MAIRTMSLGEALDKGYEVIGAPQPQRGDPTLWETANIIGRDVIPAIGGSIALSFLGPWGVAGGGATGSFVGNLWSQQYRIERGLQKRIGYGELAAATAIGAIPLGALPGKGLAARTAIRATEGSALATGELYARTYLDEGRAPTGDEISTTLLFGATFGGVLGVAEAKWLSMKTGVDGLDNKTRPQTLKLLENRIDDVGGPANYEAISPTGFFTFRDPYGNFTFRDPDVSAPTARGTNELGPRRLQALDQQALPGPRGLPGPRQARIEPRKTGSDVIIDVESMSVKDYASGVLSGLENKLLLETNDMVRALAKSDEVAPELQGLKDAFEKQIAGDKELFTGINPIVAKGNLADNKRLREIDAEIEGLKRLGHHKGVPKLKAHNAKITKLERERDKLHRKHGIIQVRGGAAGLAAGAGLVSDDEDSQMGLLGGAGVLAAGMLLPPGAGAFVRKSIKQSGAAITKAHARIKKTLKIGEEYKYKDDETGELATKVREAEDTELIDLMNEGGDWPHSGNISKKEEEFFRKKGFTTEEIYEINKAHHDSKSYVDNETLLDLLTKKEYMRLADNVGFAKVQDLYWDISEGGSSWKRAFKKAGFSKKDVDRIQKTVYQVSDQEGPIFDDLIKRSGVADATQTQLRGGAAGLAVSGTALTQAEEDELRDLGPWGIGMGLMAGAMLPPGAGGFFRKAINRIKRGVGQANNEVAKAAKSGKSPPPVEPTAPRTSQPRKEQTTPRDKQDVRSYYFDELIEFIEDGSNPVLVEQAITELSRRATRDTATALRLQRKLEELAQRGKAPKQTKATVSEEGAGRLAPAADPAARQAVTEGIEQGTVTQQRGSVANWSNKSTDELLQAIQRGDAESEFASTEALRRAANKPKTRRFFEKHAPKIFPAILAGGVSAGAVADILEEDDGEFKKAGMGGVMLLLLAAALGKRGYTKFMKTKQGRQAKIAAQLNPNKVEPDVIKAKQIDDTIEKTKMGYVSPTEWAKTMRGVKDLLNFIAVPLSRNLKKISPIILNEFRKLDNKVRQRTRKYLDKGTPFIEKMTKLLKPTLLNRDAVKYAKFRHYLLNGEYGELAKMLDELEASRVINTTKKDQLGKDMAQMRETLDEVHIAAREEGGIDLGYLKNHFPRVVKDPESFIKYLDENLDDRVVRNDIDKALDEYAQKYKLPSRDLIPPDEAAEVASRVLRGYPIQSGTSIPGGFKKRSIEKVTPDMLDAYADPADAIKIYFERAAEAIERRKFLGKTPSTATKKVGFEGSIDHVGSDLGMRMDVDESLAATVARRLGDEYKLSPEDVTKLAEIIQSRFSGKTVDSWVQGVKNATYIQVMGNFGSAITQLAEISYAAFFHGFDNTFQALFNRKDNFNFTKHFGLSDHHIDAQTSAGGLAKTLDWVFTKVGLKKFDQLSKNTIMNASWKKYRAEALRNPDELVDELSLFAGPERAREMVRALIDSKPNSKGLPKAVEELVWYKFLDLNPAAMIEMPAGYTESGNMRIAYMLKTFTIKQFDVYREAAGEDIARAYALYNKGDNVGAAKVGAKGVAKFAGLATLFAAANASTDVVKDTLYGRPTKPDDLMWNNVLRLAGINRYFVYKGKREGRFKTLFEMALPPNAVFDRALKDIEDIAGDGEYRGNMLQGTPLDLIYWRALGGLDKIENMK